MWIQNKTSRSILNKLKIKPCWNKIVSTELIWVGEFLRKTLFAHEKAPEGRSQFRLRRRRFRLPESNLNFSSQIKARISRRNICQLRKINQERWGQRKSRRVNAGRRKKKELSKDNLWGFKSTCGAYTSYSRKFFISFLCRFSDWLFDYVRTYT